MRKCTPNLSVLSRNKTMWHFDKIICDS